MLQTNVAHKLKGLILFSLIKFHITYTHTHVRARATNGKRILFKLVFDEIAHFLSNEKTDSRDSNHPINKQSLYFINDFHFHYAIFDVLKRVETNGMQF